MVIKIKSTEMQRYACGIVTEYILSDNSGEHVNLTEVNHEKALALGPALAVILNLSCIASR